MEDTEDWSKRRKRERSARDDAMDVVHIASSVSDVVDFMTPDDAAWIREIRIGMKRRYDDMETRKRIHNGAIMLERNGISPFDALPHEILERIFTLLEIRHLRVCTIVCRQFLRYSATRLPRCPIRIHDYVDVDLSVRMLHNRHSSIPSMLNPNLLCLYNVGKRMLNQGRMQYLLAVAKHVAIFSWIAYRRDDAVAVQERLMQMIKDQDTILLIARADVPTFKSVSKTICKDLCYVFFTRFAKLSHLQSNVVESRSTALRYANMKRFFVVNLEISLRLILKPDGNVVIDIDHICDDLETSLVKSFVYAHNVLFTIDMDYDIYRRIIPDSDDEDAVSEYSGGSSNSLGIKRVTSLDTMCLLFDVLCHHPMFIASCDVNSIVTGVNLSMGEIERRVDLKIIVDGDDTSWAQQWFKNVILDPREHLRIQSDGGIVRKHVGVNTTSDFNV